MTTETEESLAGIKRAIEKQDAEWSNAIRRLSELGDTPLAVSTELLEQLDSVASQPPSPIQGIRV
ncbi:MAG: hypothetical protein ACREJ3_08220 [Polyangiaceae bacterium]